MNKFATILTLALIAVSSALSAQDDQPEMKPDNRIGVGKNEKGKIEVMVETRDSIPVNTADTTIITTTNKTIYIVSKNNEDGMDSLFCTDDDKNSKAYFTHWAGIDVGINGFMDSSGDPDLGADLDYLEVDLAKSRSISFNAFEYKARLIKDYVGITTGLGLQYNNYKLKNDYTLASSSDTLIAFKDSSISLSKNKFRTTWLTVPLLLEFNTNRDASKSVHLSAGVVAGLRLGSMYKQKYKLNGDRHKHRSDFDVAPYKLEAMVRFGYGSFNLFASYQMTDLFEGKGAPELYPFTVGVTLVAFND